MASKKVAVKEKIKIPYKKPAKNRTKLVSFAVSAVIPTQQYGNIQPRIEVKSPSIEEARAFVMPIIEGLYATYAEEPLNGKTPKFLGKVTEEVVNVAAPKQEENPKEESSSSAPAPVATPVEKSSAVLKAEKAIALAASVDALGLIEDQIQKSVKIQHDEKPLLYEQVLKRRKELK